MCCISPERNCYVDQYLLKTITLKLIFLEFLDKFQTLMAPSSKMDQKLKFSNRNMTSYKQKFSEDYDLPIAYSLSL